MNKIYAFILLILADTLVGQAHLYDFGIDPWFTFGASLMFQQFMLALFIYYIVEYKHLILKTLTFIFMLTEAWDIVTYLNVENTNTAAFLNILFFVPWFIYAVYRSYDNECVKPEKDMIYKVAHRPDNFTGFLGSLIFEKPTSGSGILINDNLYIYRHGEFEKLDFKKLKKKRLIITSTGFHKDSKTIAYLQSMIGKSWLPWQNCITMQVRMRWLHRAGKL